MSKSKFRKPPLSEAEKEKKAEDFLNFSTGEGVKVANAKEIAAPQKQRVLKKEPVKALALRFPMSLADDICEISAITGLSMNAVCVELLRKVAKDKLLELKE